MKNLIISLLCGLGNRIRGGLRIPTTDTKFPLNKFWFAIIFSLSACYLYGFTWKYFLCVMLANYVGSQAYGWGEYVGCVLGLSRPSSRRDCDIIDNIVDFAKITIKGKEYKLVDYPILFGWVGLSLRGLIWTFLIGLALNNVPYMFSGLAMGTIYYICGLISRKVFDKIDKTGWNTSEFVFGAYLGIILCVI